jgi:hypothetical protein
MIMGLSKEQIGAVRNPERPLPRSHLAGPTQRDATEADNYSTLSASGACDAPATHCSCFQLLASQRRSPLTRHVPQADRPPAAGHRPGRRGGWVGYGLASGAPPLLPALPPLPPCACALSRRTIHQHLRRCRSMPAPHSHSNLVAFATPCMACRRGRCALPRRPLPRRPLRTPRRPPLWVLRQSCQLCPPPQH